jgi:hypothetical protein
MRKLLPYSPLHDIALKGEITIFCHKCGKAISEGAGFCQMCGTKVHKDETAQQASVTQQPAFAPAEPGTPAEQQSVHGLCMPMCILRFLDAAIWTIFIIAQISWGTGFGIIIWNVIATGMSYMYAMRLLGACQSNFNSGHIDKLATENRNFSGICMVWYGAQFLFTYAGTLLFFAIVIEIAILIIAIIVLSKLSNFRQ